MSKQYRVAWVIDLDADSPEDAARQALKIQRDPISIATSFDVAERCADCNEYHTDSITTVDFMERTSAH